MRRSRIPVQRGIIPMAPDWNFDNEAVQSQLLVWQRTQDPRALESVLEASRAHIARLVRGFRDVPMDETLNEVLIKVWRSAHLFDPQRGSAFSFVSRLALSVACNTQTKCRGGRNRHLEADSDFWDGIEAPVHDLHGLQEFWHQIISGGKTRPKLGVERGGQRWVCERVFCLRLFRPALQIFNL